ncbi:hypothetical protein ACSSWA_02835 [Melioribacter sp. Ez-97]|uniref:hypothetical protein n=1 Tax=Melioribacter sp. Ez-97 TaxID=3423434 RepID=UPI003EDB368E
MSDKNKILTVLVYLVLILPPINNLSEAQVLMDSSLYSVDSFSDKILRNTVDKQLSTHIFNTRLNYNYRLSGLFAGLDENFSSTVIKSTEKNIKDEQYLRFLIQYKFNNYIKTGILFYNNLYRDSRPLSINKTNVTHTSFYVGSRLWEKLDITAFGGKSTNSQIDETDEGIIYGGEINLAPTNINEFILSSFMKYQNEDISPRKNAIRYVKFDLNNELDNLINQISFNYSEQRRDFYFKADSITSSEFGINNNIQTRKESNYHISDRLTFAQLNSPLKFELAGKLSWKQVERSTRYVSALNISGSSFDSEIGEMNLELGANVDYTTETLKSTLRFTYSERDENHKPRAIEGLSQIIFNQREKTESLKNNFSKIANVSFSTLYKITTNDLLTFNLYHRKLQYDTPSPDNYDDRDELLSTAALTYLKKLSRIFAAFINLEGTFNKTVYIFSQRSSNNNVQRILKFGTGGIIESGKFRSVNTAEVSANYTVFDYEKLNPNYKSFSYRHLMLKDSTLTNVWKNLNFFVTSYVKYSEQGDFNWDNFSASPVRFLTEFYAEPKLILNIEGFNIGFGIRYFLLDTYNYTAGLQKKLASTYKSVGPIASARYIISDKIDFSFDGTYEFISSSNNYRKQINFNMYLNYRL